jgi:hypothetical protein
VNKTIINSISFRRFRFALGAFSAIVLGISFSPANGTAAVQSCDPVFGPNSSIGSGIRTSVAAHRSGLVLEVHNTDNRYTNTIWYHVGKRDGPGVNWGPSRVAANGYAPAVTISKEGYVILVHGTSQYGDALYDSDLNYRVGKIDPHGDQNQSIQWLTADKFLDAGVQSSIAMNENGLIVGVHEPGRGGDGIYYWVGRLVTPDAGRNYDIVWDSGHASSSLYFLNLPSDFALSA